MCTFLSQRLFLRQPVSQSADINSTAGIVSSRNAWELRSQSYFNSGNAELAWETALGVQKAPSFQKN